MPRLHEVGVGGGALAGRKGREALAADRGPDRLRALGRMAAGHERVAARPAGLAAGLEVGPLTVFRCLIGRAQRPGRVARRQPRRRQRAVRPDVHGRAAQQPGELGRLLGSGERGLDAPELDQQPRRLGTQHEQDRRAAAGPRQPLAALEVLETDGEPAQRPVGARQHPQPGHPDDGLGVGERGEGRGALVGGRGVAGAQRGRGRRRAGQRGRLDHRVGECAGVVAGVGRVGEGAHEVAREKHAQREPEVQAHAVLAGRGRQRLQRHLVARAGRIVVAEPVLECRGADPERDALLGVGAVHEPEQGRAPARGVAGRALRVGQRDRHAQAALGVGGGQQPQRRRPDPCRRRGRTGLELGGGVAEERDRPLVAGPRRVLDVAGAGDRAGAARGQRRRRAAVGGHAPARRCDVVDGAADDRVAEREAARDRRGADQPARHELVHRGGGGPVVQLRHRGGELGIERVAGHGGGVEQHPRAGRDRVELGGQRAGDAVGHAVQVHRRARAVRPRELLQIERVAAAVGVDGLRGRADERGRLLLVQRRRREPLERALPQRGGCCGGHRRRRLALARRRRHQHRARGQPPQQRRQRGGRGGVEPVRVVEPEQERGPGGERRQQVAQGPVHAVAVGGLGLGQRAQRGQEAGQGARVLQAEPLDAPVAQHGVQRLGQRCVGEVELGLRGPRARHPEPVAVGARRQLGQQPRLADPRLALDHQGARRPVPHPSERARQRGELTIAPDQGRGVHARDCPPRDR